MKKQKQIAIPIELNVKEYNAFWTAIEQRYRETEDKDERWVMGHLLNKLITGLRTAENIKTVAPKL